MAANGGLFGNLNNPSSIFIGEVSFESFMLFLFVIIFTFILGALAKAFIIRLLKERTQPNVYKALGRIVMYGIYALGLYLAFTKIIHFNLAAGLAALGILGVAFLLPTVPILQNIAAGILLAFERPFSEGDVVEIDGRVCKVKDRMLRRTVFRSLDGKIITVPNLVFMTTMPIINYSRGEFIKVVLDIGISSDSNKDKAIELIQKICHKNQNILPNVPEKKLTRVTNLFQIPINFFTIPKNIKALEPRVLIKSVSREKINFEVWFWIWNIFMREKIISSFYEEVIGEFKKEKIKFG